MWLKATIMSSTDPETCPALVNSKSLRFEVNFHTLIPQRLLILPPTSFHRTSPIYPSLSLLPSPRLKHMHPHTHIHPSGMTY